jgi:arginine decarboxylase
MKKSTDSETKDNNSKSWSIEEAKKHYHIDHWGSDYFSVNDNGSLVVLPENNLNGPIIDLKDVIDEIKGQDIKFPVLVRFQDILRSQVVGINKTFQSVIEEASYQGKFVGVYPIKVNQMREVVEEIVDAGTDYQFGLEAGSKSELLSVLALNDNDNALTVLNGFKDQDYLSLAMLGRKLGRKVIIVIEKFSELLETLKVAKEMNAEPIIGFRVKLYAQGSGRWSNSGGERAKFGLTIPELLKAVDLLKAEKKEHWAKLFHFHVGSQITDIRTVKNAVTEGSRIYAKLVKMGLPLEYFDVGGGLGVDYDGSKSTLNSSRNYNLNEYVEDIVYIIKQICDVEQVAHPNIVSESGRALTAMHSCILLKVFDQIKMGDPDFPVDKKENEHMLVSNMREFWEELNSDNYQEIYNDALQTKNECINAFKLGILSLEERGTAETLFWKVCKKVNGIIKVQDFVPEELKELDDYLADQYLCNASFFQSVPDSWAINQLFPILPVMRLNEKPTVKCTLTDITCDSDGKINEFINLGQPQRTLMLHKRAANEDYYIGFFMTGAYQDIMGNVHNLFGRLNEVHIFSDDEDPTDFYIEEVIEGDLCKDVLAELQYNTNAMASTIKRQLDKQVQKGNLLPKEGVRLTNLYEKCLKSYTYLKK